MEMEAEYHVQNNCENISIVTVYGIVFSANFTDKNGEEEKSDMIRLIIKLDATDGVTDDARIN